MNSYIQVLSFTFSFSYGIFFYLASLFNKTILNKKSNIPQIFITLIFIIDIVILYIYLMYKINNGKFHIYFIISMILGYMFMMFNKDKLYHFCKKNVNKLKKH